jgi:hypothetical protein
MTKRKSLKQMLTGDQNIIPQLTSGGGAGFGISALPGAPANMAPSQSGGDMMSGWTDMLKKLLTTPQPYVLNDLATTGDPYANTMGGQNYT